MKPRRVGLGTDLDVDDMGYHLPSANLWTGYMGVSNWERDASSILYRGENFFYFAQSEITHMGPSATGANEIEAV
jgi:hypothetical protein